jgi:lycopene cyclase domain-containing protein
MTYTQLSVLAVIVAIILDLFVIRTQLLRKKVFWTAYAIIIVFQLISNGILTGFRIVRYSGDAIIGNSTPADHAPPFLGDGRIVFAPIEDLLFGFSLVLLTLVTWVWLGRVGIQREPKSGPPHTRIARFFK